MILVLSFCCWGFLRLGCSCDVFLFFVAVTGGDGFLFLFFVLGFVLCLLVCFVRGCVIYVLNYYLDSCGLLCFCRFFN